MKLKDNTILITGSARGIGEAVARSCAAAGANLVIADFDEAGAQATAARLCAEGVQALAIAVDVSQRSSVEAMVAAAIARFGRIDGLVNNAGIVADAQLKKMTDAQWESVIGVNLRGPYNCAHALVDHFLENGSGSIVNISSVVGLYGNFGQTNYAAAKAGLIGMTKTWAKELGRKGIRSNAICPGFIRTPILDSMPDKVLAEMASKVPLGRLGRPEEIGTVAAFLCSEGASYVNGAVIEVSGGISM